MRLCSTRAKCCSVHFGLMYPPSLMATHRKISPKEYEGAVHASEALIHSLNVPAVHELRDYRYEKFYDLLTNIGITTLKKPADHYGLTLILGGAEGSLWDITGAFASMARTLNNYSDRSGKKSVC